MIRSYKILLFQPFISVTFSGEIIMNFRQFRRGFSKIQSNLTWWFTGNLFCYGFGYQIQTCNLGQDQYFLVYNPIRWEFNEALQKMVLSWDDNTGRKVMCCFTPSLTSR